MDELKESLEKLKLLFKTPRLFLANYFIDLKTEIDEYFVQKLIDSKDKEDMKIQWVEIIKRIELFENDCYKSMPTNKFNQEFTNEINQTISQIESKIENLNEPYSCEKLENSIEKLEYKIKKKLFRNCTFIFFKNYEQKNFLLIIRNEYFSKKNMTSIMTKPFTLSNERLKALVAKKELSNHLSNENNPIEFSLDLNKITKQYLNSSGIHSIENDTFEDLIHLEKINLGFNILTQLDTGSFRNLAILKELILTYNYISFIDENVFQDLKHLCVLNLSNNNIQYIYPKTFNGLNNLIYLDLSINKISSIDKSLFQDLYNLKEINLAKNRLEHIEKDFCKLLSKDLIVIR